MKPLVIGVLSTAFAGSTMLNLMLGSHSELSAVGELWAVQKYPAACSNCIGTGRACPVYTPEFVASLPDGRGVHSRLIERLGTGLVDSSKNAVWFRRSMEPQVRYHFAVLSKAPHEQAAAYIRRPETDAEYHPLDQFGAVWTRFFKTTFDFLRETGTTWSLVRYAELADDPAATLARVLSDADLAFEPGMERYWEFEHHQVHGNWGALHAIPTFNDYQQGQGRPHLWPTPRAAIRRDESWRKILTPEQVRAAWGQPGVAELAARLGHEPPSDLDGEASGSGER